MNKLDKSGGLDGHEGQQHNSLNSDAIKPLLQEQNVEELHRAERRFRFFSPEAILSLNADIR
jgi:hypothetical protein